MSYYTLIINQVIKMVKIRGFQGLIFKPELYEAFLDKNMEYLGRCSFIKEFNPNEFISKGQLCTENSSIIYLYQQQFLGFITLGVLAELSLEDYQQHKIKKHQRTLVRQNLNEQTYAKRHVGPVIVGHQHFEDIDIILHKHIKSTQPFAAWQTVDGRKHKLWRLASFDSLINQFSKIQSCCILDGHHRFEAASTYLQKIGQKAIQKNKWIQGLIYSTKYIRTYPQFRKLIHQDYELIIRYLIQNKNLKINQIQIDNSSPNNYELVLLLRGRFYQIQYETNQQVGIMKFGIQKLDQILIEAFQAIGKKIENSIKYLPAIMLDWNILLKQTHPIFLVKCPTIDTILEKANNNEIMPAKSTWLQPKPCLHMVIRLPY